MFTLSEVLLILNCIRTTQPDYSPERINQSLQELIQEQHWPEEKAIRVLELSERLPPLLFDLQEAEPSNLQRFFERRKSIKYALEFELGISDGELDKPARQKIQTYYQIQPLMRLNCMINYHRFSDNMLLQATTRLARLFDNYDDCVMFLHALGPAIQGELMAALDQLPSDYPKDCNLDFWKRFLKQNIGDIHALKAIRYGLEIEALFKSKSQRKIVMGAIAESQIKAALSKKPGQDRNNLKETVRKQVWDRFKRGQLEDLTTKDINWLAALSMSRAQENVEAAKFIYDLDLGVYHFSRYLDVTSQGIQSSDALLPPIMIDGRDYGAKGYYIVKMDPADPLTAFLGYPTGCCQSIRGAGEECVIHGITHNNSGFYALIKGKLPKGKIESTRGLFKPSQVIAQTWAWREENEVVFDSIEVNDIVHQTPQQLMRTERMFFALADALSKSCPEITRIHVGESQSGLILGFSERALPLEQNIHLSGYAGYSDAFGKQRPLYTKALSLELEAKLQPDALIARFAANHHKVPEAVRIFRTLLADADNIYVKRFIAAMEPEYRAEFEVACHNSLVRPLIIALEKFDTDLVQFLLANNTSANESDHRGFPALTLAIQNRYTAAIELLLNHGADANGAHMDTTPLSEAISTGQVEVVEWLLAQGASPNTTFGGGVSVLELAIEYEDVEVITLLINKGAEFSPEIGHKLLCLAIYSNYYGLMQCLIKRDIDVNAYLPGEATPMGIALEMGDIAASEILRQAGANARQAFASGGQHILVRLAMIDNLKMMQFYFEHLDPTINIDTPEYQVVLKVAARNNSPRLLPYLLSRTDNIDNICIDGTPIYKYLIQNNLLATLKTVVEINPLSPDEQEKLAEFAKKTGRLHVLPVIGPIAAETPFQKFLRVHWSKKDTERMREIFSDSFLWVDDCDDDNSGLFFLHTPGKHKPNYHDDIKCALYGEQQLLQHYFKPDKWYELQYLLQSEICKKIADKLTELVPADYLDDKPVETFLKALATENVALEQAPVIEEIFEERPAPTPAGP